MTASSMSCKHIFQVSGYFERCDPRPNVDVDGWISLVDLDLVVCFKERIDLLQENLSMRS